MMITPMMKQNNSNKISRNSKLQQITKSGQTKMLKKTSRRLEWNGVETLLA